MFANIRQRVARVRRRAARRGRITAEYISAGLCIHQRLVQMPATGHDVGKRRAAHEGGVVTRAAQRLLDRAAKQHHVVGGGQCVGGFKHGLYLAGAQLDFQ